MGGKMVWGSLALFLFLTSNISAHVADVRDKKVLSLFSVVTFPNQQCTGESSTTTKKVLGTCFSSTECSDKGGVADGNCASGFGVCCTFLVSDCGSTVSNNCTYIQNPSYPASYTTAGACVDSFGVTVGSSRVYQSLCGTNSGEHVYLETGRATTAQKLTFTLGATSTVAQWRVKVSQIECSATWKAPADCYQYYTGVSGSAQSFNYPSPLVDGLMYSICVRQETGFCAIEWSAAATTIDSFHLSTIAAPTVGLALGATASGAAYIHIPGSDNGNYAGGHLSDDGTTTAANQESTDGVVQGSGQLFHVEVNSHDVDADTVGFNLVWNQVPCSNGFMGTSS